MNKIVFNCFLLIGLFYYCNKNRGKEFKEARVISYIIAATLSFAMIGKAYFYESKVYMIGLAGGILSFFFVGAYFAWKRRDEPGMKMVLYTVGAFFLLLAFAVLAFYFDVFSYFFPE